jgi:hypothetical protein
LKAEVNFRFQGASGVVAEHPSFRFMKFDPGDA